MKAFPTSRPVFESLEQRQLLNAGPISGFVFEDPNNSGVLIAGDKPIANSTIELHDSSGKTLASALTDTNGAYSFSTNDTISTAPTTKTVLVTFDSTRTGWTQNKAIQQFDPSLGTLTSIDIIHSATVNSDYQLENTDSEAGTINASVAGTITLNGATANPMQVQASTSTSFDAGAFDNSIDFGGASGEDTGIKTASNTQTVTLTSAADLARYTGTGTVAISEHAGSTSNISGPGNVVSVISTSIGSQVQVVYHYIPNNSLQPGTYTIVQPNQPTGYVPGLKSSNGQVIPNSVNTNSIPVTLVNNGSSANNNFAELKAASVSGYVYIDASNSGVKLPSSPPVPGTTIGLTGTDDTGAPVNLSTTTDGNGFYQFANLRPGNNYTITETQPAGLLEGQENLGTLGGTKGNDQFFIALGAGSNGQNYNFGEVLPAVAPTVQPPPPPTPAPAPEPAPAPAPTPDAFPPTVSKFLMMGSLNRRNH
jgi:hypothetical protein